MHVPPGGPAVPEVGGTISVFGWVPPADAGPGIVGGATLAIRYGADLGGVSAVGPHLVRVTRHGPPDGPGGDPGPSASVVEHLAPVVLGAVGWGLWPAMADEPFPLPDAVVFDAVGPGFAGWWTVAIEDPAGRIGPAARISPADLVADFGL